MSRARALALACAVGLVATIVGPPQTAIAGELEDGQWYVDFLRLRQAQQITKGEGVTVGVIDTGVGQHPDLAGNVLAGKDVQTAADGRRDNDGHGTAMAGLVAAHGKVLGVAPKATILPVKGGDVELGFDTGAAIDWAIDHGAMVLCVARSGEPTSTEERAIKRAVAADVVVVAGVGNTDRGPHIKYPAAYPGVLVAAGVDRKGNHASISVRSPLIVLAAPSDGISSTAPGGRYRVGTGTSDSTALIAGAVALVRAKYPELKADEVIHRLTATADDKGPVGRDDEYGYGVINIVKALTADVPPLQAETSAPPSAQAGGGTDDGKSRVPVGWILAGAGALLAVVVLFVLIGRRRPSG